jgi:flagellar basal body rod protein FlgC
MGDGFSCVFMSQGDSRRADVTLGRHALFGKSAGKEAIRMKIMSVAAAGMAQQTRRLEQSAERVAQLGDPKKEPGQEVDLAREAVERIEASALTTANLKVIQAEDERLGTLLDTFV